tara:strand:- start:267 stop:671 length:405 start_codon:yes stop_codon:yes gene_type:complete
MAVQYRITFVYNRLNIKDIKSKINYSGSSEQLRRNILNRTISSKFAERISELYVYAMKTELVSKEQNKSMAVLIHSVGYKKVADFLGEKSKRFTMEIHGYNEYMDRMMSIHRYEYLKRKMFEYLASFREKCYLL